MNWIQKIRAFFKSGEHTKKSDQVSDDIPNVFQDTDDIGRLILNEEFLKEDKVLSEKIQEHIIIYGNNYALLGVESGKVGARDFSIGKTSCIHASLIADRVASTLHGLVESLKYGRDEREQSLSDLRVELMDIQTAKAEVEQRKIDDSKSFQLFFAVLYIFFGMAMILADIAVSINLVTYFGIGGIEDKATFIEKLKDVELLFFSLGIAFCTVYVKILYDEYIHNKLGLKQMEVIKLSNGPLRKSTIVAELVFKAFVKLLILVGLLYLLYYLAKYRTYFTLMDNDTEVAANIGSLSDIADKKEVSEVLLHSFIGITVIVPIISGVALSIGFRIFSNIFSLRNIRSRYRKTSKLLQDGKSKVELLVLRLTKLEKYSKEWENREARVQQISDYFSERYNQGFRAGYRKQFGNDLYKIVEDYRNEVVTRNLTKQINNGIS